MKIKIRQHDASMPEEDGWSQRGDWFGGLRANDHATPAGDGHAEPDGTGTPWAEIFAQADARAEVKPLTAVQRSSPRPLEVAECSMCGVALPLGLLVPDGGQACADIRWYCKDAMSCTKRWTTARLPRSAYMPTAPEDAVAGAGETVSDRARAEHLDSMPEAAQSAV